MKTQTPRTDAQAGYPDEGGCWKYNPQGEYVDAETCRQIERELSDMRENAEYWNKMAADLANEKEPLMKFNLSNIIKENFVGKMLEGKLIDRAFLTYDQDGGNVVLRVHFSPVDYMDHVEIELTDDIELTEP